MSSTKENKTLIILTPGFPANEDDTTCLPFLQSHIKAFRNESPTLEIIILTFQYPYIVGTYRWHNFEVISFGGREQPKMKRLMLWMKVWNELNKLKGKKDIVGILSVWCTECSLIAHYFARYNRLKNFIWVFGQDAKKENKYVKLIRPSSNELITISDFLKREFYKNHGVKPERIIPFGIDSNEFSKIERDRDIDILGVGSLIPLKQYDVFVNIVKELKETFPQIKTAICGKGPEEEKLTTSIEKFHLQKQILLYGEIPHNEVLIMMSRAKIFLHPSSYEGLGAVCLEALYAGAHVISFTKPLDENIEHWHHVKDKNEMVNKIKELIDDRSTSYTSVMPYKISDTAKQIMKLFEE